MTPRARAYLVYQDIAFDGSRPDFAAPTKGVLVRVSADDGRTWTPAQPVNASVPSPDRLLPAAAVDPATARLAVAWHDFREGGARLFGRVFATVERPPQPNAPLNLRATPVSRTQVDLAWTDASDDETGFEIRRSLGGVVTAYRLAAGTTTFSDTGLPEDTAVACVVRALNGAGFSTAGNVRTTRTLAPPPAPPSAPADLRAEAVAASQIRLTWRDTSANEQRFEVERSVAGGSFVPVVTALPPGTTSFLDGGLRRNTTYTYRVRACNAGGCSAYAGPASATTRRR